ncbi:MAG: hypothetical protein WAX69_01920 [Victivallales bacterium]
MNASHTILKLITVAIAVLVVASPSLAGGGRNRVMGGELEIPPVSAPVKIDGDLEEWDASRAQLLTLEKGGGEDSKSEIPLTRYSAKIAFMHDKDALYAGVWWNDPTPLGTETSPGYTPGGDGLILSIPLDGMRHLAFWCEPGGTTARAVMSMGDAPLSTGKELKGVKQGYKITGRNAYMQEIAIPWSELGGKINPGTDVRLGVELCFGGLDPAAGYKAWQNDVISKVHSAGNRWGGGMCWGFVDGIRSPDMTSSGYDPANGAEVKCMPAGSMSEANPPVMFMGNEQTRTTKMIAVPAPSTTSTDSGQAGSGQGGKITVDGEFSPGEWDDKSGTTISSESTLLPNRYATKIHFAYGADGLYVGLRWFTGGAHLNINNPSAINHGYDGGDAVQIRLGTDRVTHVDAWYYDEGNKPFVVLTYGAKFDEGQELDAIAKGAKMAIKTLPQGGYTQELFFPWSMITKSGQALKTGDSFRVIFDLFYSGLEGNRIPFILNTKLAQPTGVALLPFTAPRDGFYSTIISDDKGDVIRRLLTHAKMRNGQVIEWDGLDNDGKPAAPGAYSFRGLHHSGVGMKYLSTYNNPGTPPWQTDDGKGDWGGDESAPAAVAADDWGVYLGWPGAEDGDGIIGCDFNGKKRWGFFQTPFPTAVSSCLLASDGRYLYFAHEANVFANAGEKDHAYYKTIISCIDRTTGKRAELSLAKSFPEISRHSIKNEQVNWWWDLYKDKNFSLDTCGIQDEYSGTGQCFGSDLGGFAARDGKLYFSLRKTNEIVAYDVKSITEKLKDAPDSSTVVEPINRWKVNKPAGIAFSTDGQLFAISDHSIVRVDTADGKASEVLNSGLSAPVGLAIDKEGVLYVSDWGDAQCVKVFSQKGQPLRTIGLPGGRPWIGKYDPKGMLMPRGIAVDKDGKLWVAENDIHPSRISVWNAKTGELIREFVGGTFYGGCGGGQIDPKIPSHALSAFGTLFEINLEKEEYHPLAALWRRTSLNACFKPLWYGGNGGTRFHEINGRRFIISSDSGRLVLSELKDDMTDVPRAAIGGIPNRGDNTLVSHILKQNNGFICQTIYPDFMYGHPDENFIWTDLNGDGMVQADEVQWRKKSADLPILGCMFWQNGGIDGKNDLVMGTIYGDAIIRLPFQGMTEKGAPRYDLDKTEIVARPGGQVHAVACNEAGDVFTVYAAEALAWLKPDNPYRPAVTAYGKDSKKLWSWPTDMDVRQWRNVNGEGIMGPFKAPGETGEIFGLTQWHGIYVPLITTDGLLVGRLLRDPAEGGEPGPDMYRGETIQCMSRLDDGRIILSHGKNAHHLFEVTGLDQVKRFDGKFTLTDAQSSKAAELLAAAKKKLDKTAPVQIVTVKDAPVIDGKLDEWDWKMATAIGPKDKTPRAEAAFRADDKTLCLAYKVFKGGPFINKGDDPKQLFVGGDAVDFQFCADPSADPKRKEPVMGDCRLLISKFGDKPGSGEPGRTIAMLYRAKAPGAKQPVAFRNPAGGQTVFDEVLEIKDAKIMISDTPEGYLVEASVPLKSLFDMRPALWKGRVLQGDVGVIIADSTSRRIARLYRFNQDTQIISDLPTEARLTPDKWGEIEVE